MAPEFEALNKYVQTIGPHDHIIMFCRTEAAVIAKTRSRWGSQQVLGQAGRMDTIDHLYLPAQEQLTKLLPSVLESIQKRFHVSSGKGRRHVFVGKRIVVKVPYDVRGLIDNFSEAHVFSHKKDPNLARCKICLVGGLPVLAMEKITIDPTFSDVPSWAQYLDRRQVGVNRKGEWKAYDYGLV